MRPISGPLLLLVFASGAFAYSDTTVELQKSFNDALAGKEVILRAPFAEKRISLSADGSCASGCSAGGWAEDGSIFVKHIKISERELSVLGERLLVFFDRAGTRIALRVKQPVEVLIALADLASRQTASDALVLAFRAASEPQPTAAPPDPNHPEAIRTEAGRERFVLPPQGDRTMGEIDRYPRTDCHRAFSGWHTGLRRFKSGQAASCCESARPRVPRGIAKTKTCRWR